jgi:5-methylcytosine-specific restriction endonuclease McrA
MTRRGAGGNNGQGSSWIRPEKRRRIYARDGYACVYCGKKPKKPERLTLDHVQPRALGGSNEAGNLVSACSRCNAAKRNRRLAAFLGMLLLQGIDAAVVSKRVAAAQRRALPVSVTTGGETR